MSSRLEAKLLGEDKMDNYCSSSEDEGPSEPDQPPAPPPLPLARQGASETLGQREYYKTGAFFKNMRKEN